MSEETQGLMQPEAFRLDRTLDEKLCFCLENLRGATKFTDFIAFDCEPGQATPITLVAKMEGLHIADPRSYLPDIIALSRIHHTIKQKTDSLHADEKLQARFWLASLFHHYLSRYDLFQEGFSCRRAWAHLLKMRYHSLAELYRLRCQAGQQSDERKNEPLTKGERHEFLRAFRDWRDFCTNDRNHFLFRPDQKLGSPEAEVKAAIFGAGTDPSAPLPFFLADREGRKLLDFLVADWFLRDRYDWLTALLLVWHRVQAWCRRTAAGILGERAIGPHRALTPGGAIAFLSLLVVLLSGVIVLWSWLTGIGGWVAVPLSLIYLSSLLCLVLGTSWRAILDLLLPRVWAGVIVGYLPLFLTSELWKMAYDCKWPQCKPWLIGAMNLCACFLAFGYLRLEVGNKLVRTPGLSRYVSIGRPAWLTVYGWVVSVVSGLMLFGLAGASMARAVGLDEKQCNAAGSVGLFGNVHLSALFLFAPLALLIGVIVQVFWEEKSITHPA